jgi:hypothetical protein
LWICESMTARNIFFLYLHSDLWGQFYHNIIRIFISGNRNASNFEAFARRPYCSNSSCTSFKSLLTSFSLTSSCCKNVFSDLKPYRYLLIL